ncbi:hypothetical protein PAXINDRAFT_15297 [Paxillus involutus ATCC 200175]|uniref:Uncharacterized protein n=1 Tax=Paxillus involutus ATCC 200175 TaxID=664439 RepID=A0A0C9ST57_PAXIN|nr:hypothetical protein PAXINDRAFT_15297 [Paxillus involutus ATCC 200175]
MHSRSPSPQDPVGDHVVCTDLTDVEIAVLDRRLPAWMECSKDKKKDNFKVVCEELNQWDSCKKQYKTWIYNHGRVRAQEALTKYHREWMARAVVMRTKKAEITALIQETKGDGQDDGEELEEAEKEAEQWNNERPPLAVQADTALCKGKQYAREFASTMWKQCGMRVVILTAWQNEAKRVVVSSHDFNTEVNGGGSFNHLKDIQKDWDQYAQESFGCDADAAAADTDSEVLHAGLPKCKTRLDPVELVTRGDGKPWVMDIKQVGLDSLKDFIRGYFTYHYRVACGIPNAAVPWGEVSRDQNKYLSPTYLPPNFKVGDPSKMHKKDAIILLDFWRSRQDEDEDSVLAFRRWRGTDGMLQEPVDVHLGNSRPRVAMKKKLKARRRDVLPEKIHQSAGRGTANDGEAQSEIQMDWSESDVPGIGRGRSVKKVKVKAKRTRRMLSPGEDELPATTESPGMAADGQAPKQDSPVPTKAIHGILKKPMMQHEGRSPEVSKSMPCPKPTIKHKTMKPGNAEGSSSSKRARAPSGDCEEDVDAVRPMKKVKKDLAKTRRHAATPFPDVNDIEDTRRSTRKRKAPLPADFSVSLKRKGGSSRKQN